jgi:phage protein U
MMTLGDFQFGIATAAYQELARVTEWRWPAQERFMQGQALQYVGPGGDTIALPGVIYPEYRGGLGQLDAIRALANQGQAMTMVSGTGTVMGRWVVERLEDKGTIFSLDGLPRKQEFVLGLRKFDETGVGTTAGTSSAATTLATVVDTATPLASAQALTNSAGGTFANIAGTISSSMAAVEAQASAIGTAVSGILQPINRAMGVATGLQNSVADAKRLLGSVPTGISGKASLSKLLSAANNAVMNSSQAGATLKRSLGDLTALGTTAPSALQAVQTAMTSVNKLTVAATSLQGQASTLLGKIGA